MSNKSDFCELYGFSKICLISSEKEQKIKREENEKKKMRKRGVEGRGTSTGKTHIRENTEKNMREKRHTFWAKRDLHKMVAKFWSLP